MSVAEIAQPVRSGLRAPFLAVETGVASMFVIIAAAAVTGTPWLLVVGLAGHGVKDLWQHRRHFVANTQPWLPSWRPSRAMAQSVARGRASQAFCLQMRPLRRGFLNRQRVTVRHPKAQAALFSHA